MSVTASKVKTHKGLDNVWSQAEYSHCEKYRYFLTRIWDQEKKLLAFIMLNPSTATELENDPTVERCERRARAMGYGGVAVLNIFAYRATDPKDMKAAEDPIGDYNNEILNNAMAEAYDLVDFICGWGNHGDYLDRGKTVLKLLKYHEIEPMALKWNKSGQPQHPLYVPYSAKPVPRIKEPRIEDA